MGVQEERLGEDDLWYCPRCKKHQQATKKFDLWKAPDILVVHLKRFSNNRTMRDKIDTFVDFPIDDLDLGERVGERQVAQKLLAEGMDITALGLRNPDEPLVYDLFGVDEHMGGLGGGHYRAYALNHLSGRWHHFDDSYVTLAQAKEAVVSTLVFSETLNADGSDQNSNAYLLFYRRRSTQALGGKTAEKIEQARRQPQSLSPKFGSVTIDAQLPTPPDETASADDVTIHGPKYKDREIYGPARPPHGEDWLTPRSHNVSNGGSIGSSPPQLDEIELSTFDSAPAFAHMSGLDDFLVGPQFNFPDPSSKASPTSSNEAEPDLDDDRPGGDTWPTGADGDVDQPRLYQHADAPFGDSFSTAMPWNSPQSPHGSATSDPNPFTDVNAVEPQAEGAVIDDSIATANDHTYDVPRAHDESSEMLP